MRLPNVRDYSKTYIVKDELWELRFTRRIRDRKRPDDAKTLGLCDPSEKIIQIRLSQSKYETLRTFVHEFIHAAEEEYDFHLTEKEVEKLACAIVHFLITNF